MLGISLWYWGAILLAVGSAYCGYRGASEPLNESVEMKNIQEQNSAISGDGGLSVGKNEGTINNYSSPKIEVKPIISMEIETNEEKPFHAKLLFKNNTDIDALSVNVSVIYYEYLGSNGTLIKNDYSREDIHNTRRQLGKIEARGYAEAFIDDLIVDEKPNEHSILVEGSGMDINMGNNTIIVMDGDKIVSQKQMPVYMPSGLHLINKASICLKVTYDWLENESKKSEPKIFGMVIDKSQGIKKWVKRTQHCEQFEQELKSQ
jgi:hypothetical protein